MSSSDKPETLDSYNFLAKQVRALLIVLAALTILTFLGRPDGTLVVPQVFWGLSVIFALGAAAGFIANLTGIILLMTSSGVYRKTLRILSAILSVINGVIVANLLAALLGIAPNTIMACVLAVVAQIVAQSSIWRE